MRSCILTLLDVYERLSELQATKLDDAEACVDPETFSERLAESRGVGEARAVLMHVVQNLVSQMEEDESCA